jgi:hypothetical protein
MCGSCKGLHDDRKNVRIAIRSSRIHYLWSLQRLPAAWVNACLLQMNERYLGRVQLSAGIYPTACFHLKELTGKVMITERCNLYGYWKTEISLS